MAARQSDEGEISNGTVVVRRRRWRRVAAIASMVFMALFVLLIAGVWVARRPIATEVLRQQFEQSGVRATYTLDRVGLTTQQVSNLVIGDPKNPDLIARHALSQVRWKLNGGVRVYRIVARGVRLKGKVIDGKVNWGEVSKLLPPPTGNARPAIGTLVSPCAPGGAIRPVIRARAAPRACIFGAAGIAGPGTWHWSGSLICRIRTRAQHPPHPFGGRAHVHFAHFGRMAGRGGEGPSPHDVA